MDGVRSRCDLHRGRHIRRNRSVRNAVLAAEIGITREALYRTLAVLEAEGCLTRTQTTILLKRLLDASVAATGTLGTTTVST